MDYQPDQNSGETGQSSGEKSSGNTWQEVGKQFQTMGEGLASVFQTAWQKEENRKRLKGIEDGLETLVENIGQVIRETEATPEAQHFQQQARKTVETLREAGEQTAQEVRPHLLFALRQVNEEIQKLLDRMEDR